MCFITCWQTFTGATNPYWHHAETNPAKHSETNPVVKDSETIPAKHPMLRHCWNFHLLELDQLHVAMLPERRQALSI
jgi:hypothetical protein